MKNKKNIIALIFIFLYLLNANNFLFSKDLDKASDEEIDKYIDSYYNKIETETQKKYQEKTIIDKQAFEIYLKALLLFSDYKFDEANELLNGVISKYPKSIYTGYSKQVIDKINNEINNYKQELENIKKMETNSNLSEIKNKYNEFLSKCKITEFADKANDYLDSIKKNEKKLDTFLDYHQKTADAFISKDYETTLYYLKEQKSIYYNNYSFFEKMKGINENIDLNKINESISLCEKYIDQKKLEEKQIQEMQRQEMQRQEAQRQNQYTQTKDDFKTTDDIFANYSSDKFIADVITAGAILWAGKKILDFACKDSGSPSYSKKKYILKIHLENGIANKRALIGGGGSDIIIYISGRKSGDWEHFGGTIMGNSDDYVGEVSDENIKDWKNNIYIKFYQGGREFIWGPFFISAGTNNINLK